MRITFLHIFCLSNRLFREEEWPNQNRNEFLVSKNVSWKVFPVMIKHDNVFFLGETAANLEPLQHNHIGKVHKGNDC
jgi:hypothetical protein